MNDSKATNVAAAAAALRSFDGGVRAILGGSLKGGDFDGLAEPVAERCTAAYLIGEAEERIERELEPARAAGVEIRRCDDLAAAVAAAAADAEPRRGRAAGPRVRQLRRLPRLRAARRALPSPGRSSSMKKGKRSATPVEYSLLLTATLCLLAFGVVMVFSASSTTQLLGESGDSAFYLKRTLIFGALGLLVMHLLARRGIKALRPLTPLLLAGAFFLCAIVMLPGVGVEVNGSRAWLGAGPVQIQPSELMKLALILFAAQLLATRPEIVKGGVGAMAPVLTVVGAGVFVVGVGDLGTALVTCLAITALLVGAGARLRDIGLLAAGAAVVVLLAVLIEPYRVARITSFLDPGGDPGGAGFQLIQAKIALGSGGLFGVGLGESLQKAFYLPEAHTDMIAAVIGEELGLVGIGGLVGLYGLFGYAGFQDRPVRPRSLRQAARRRDHVAGPGPGAGQPAGRVRPRTAHRGPAAVRLLRQREHAGDAGRRRAAPQRLTRGQRRLGAQAVERRWETARRRRRARRRASRPRRAREEAQSQCRNQQGS